MSIDIHTAWIEQAENIDTQLVIPSLLALQKENAWQGNPAFENLLPRFVQARSQFSEFFSAFDYEWILERDSYWFPQEVLYQFYAMEAILGLWQSVPSERRFSEEFGRVAARFTLDWRLSGTFPYTLPFNGSFRFIVVPYACLDSFWICFRSLFDQEVRGLSILDFVERQRPEIPSKVTRACWDALVVKALCANFYCPDAMQQSFHRTLSNKLDTIEHLQAFPFMTTMDRLGALAQRFALSHEVGHFLAPALEDLLPSDSELAADLLAVSALENVDPHRIGEGYEELADDLRILPQLSGIAFYYVHAMWTGVLEAVEKASGAQSDAQARRTALLNSRIHHWADIVGRVNRSSTHDASFARHAFLLERFSHTVFDHVASFSMYAQGRVDAMYGYAAEVAEQLQQEVPEAADPMRVDALLKAEYGGDIRGALERILAQTATHPKNPAD